MRKLLYRYQVFGTKGLEEKMMDALIKEKPDFKDGYYSVSKLRYAVEKDERLCHDISVPHNKAGVFFSIALYDKGYIIFGDGEHPGIRPIKWYEPRPLLSTQPGIKLNVKSFISNLDELTRISG